jgi:phage terminase large subunit-like protein
MEVAAPRFEWVPPIADESWFVEATELCAAGGLVLDGWQSRILRALLGRKDDGRWACFEVAGAVPRQNGKGAVFEARLAAGLFITDERFLMHSAHRTDTSLDAMRRLLDLIEAADLTGKIRRVRNTNGQEGIELLDGRRLRFRTRNKGGGRGFSADFLGADECMDYPEFAHAALLPTLSARPNPQVLYMGSAVDQETHDNGLVFSRLRRRGIAGDDPSLAWFEWAAPFDHPDELDSEAAVSAAVWRQANPALGIRITEEYVANEQRSLDARSFAVERLGVGDWPDPDLVVDRPFTVEAWDELRDDKSVLEPPVMVAFDVSPERRTAIAAAGMNQNGDWHVEVHYHRQGTGWVAGVLERMWEGGQVDAIFCDSVGPASSLIATLQEAGVRVETVNTTELGQACGRLVDMVNDKTLRHLGSEELRNAVIGARIRPIGDGAWAWGRKHSTVDISPLVASTIAVGVAVGVAGSEVAIF